MKSDRGYVRDEDRNANRYETDPYQIPPCLYPCFYRCRLVYRYLRSEYIRSVYLNLECISASVWYIVQRVSKGWNLFREILK